MATITVRIPDIGDFEDVVVIEVLVAPGDRIAPEDPLVTLESDKATMDIPAPRAGVVREVLLAVDDAVSEGAPILTLEVEEAEAEAETDSAGEQEERRERPAAAEFEEKPAAPAPAPEREAAPSADAPTPVRAAASGDRFDVAVVGAGPGGYTAAFRAADLGLRVALVERHENLGGVCLNVGCIPSKALLHVAEVVASVEDLAPHGVEYGAPRFDFAKLRAHKDEVVGRLTGGLAKLARQRKVEVVRGTARFADAHTLEVEDADGARTLPFEHAIIAVGSRPATLPGLPDDPRILDSTAALEVEEGVGSLLVIGGGVIGLEMAAVYDALGTRVTVVELLSELMSGTDPDLVRPLQRRIAKRYAGIHLATKVAGVEAREKGLRVRFEGKGAPPPADFDRVLVAVGRVPNGDRIGAEHAGVAVDDRGFIAVDQRLRTNVAHIQAIGDVTGAPLLAHRATHQGKAAAEVIAGLPAAFDAQAVPSVAYTDPEIAWTGLSEARAHAEGVAVDVARFPWAASGRALGIGRSEGFTKLLFSKETGRLVGAGIVGRSAGELIAEATLAIELGADAEDLALTVHAHPTLSETVAFAAEMAAGTITDAMPPKKKA